MIQDSVRRQAVLLAVIAAAVALLWVSAALHAGFIESLGLSKAVAEAHPLASRLAFVALAAASAMLVLFSSVPLVPVAVFAWGQGETLALLTLGWFLGANAAYLIGRRFGRPATELFVAARKLDRYGHLLAAEMSVAAVTVVKLALPSEVPSFALGILRYPLPKFMLVVLASELPFAVWSVYLSAAVIDDRRAAFLLVLLAGFAALGLVSRWLLRRQG